MADPGFPAGGRGFPRRVHFENFVCQNERIQTLRGGVRRASPPRSANARTVYSVPRYYEQEFLRTENAFYDIRSDFQILQFWNASFHEIGENDFNESVLHNMAIHACLIDLSLVLTSAMAYHRRSNLAYHVRTTGLFVQFYVETYSV